VKEALLGKIGPTGSGTGFRRLALIGRIRCLGSTDDGLDRVSPT